MPRIHRCPARFDKPEVFAVLQKHKRQPLHFKPLGVRFYDTPKFLRAGAAVVYNDSLKKRSLPLP